MPQVYFNDPAYRAYRDSDTEDMNAAASRLIVSTNPDFFIFPGRRELNPEIGLRYAPVEIRSNQGNYFVIVHERR